MAKETYALTNLSKVKGFLDIDDTDNDDLFNDLINSISDFIENYCGRRFLSTVYAVTPADTAEYFDGDDIEEDIYLKNFPITALSKVEYNNGSFSAPDWKEYDADRYSYDKNSGIINFPCGVINGKQNIRVSYTAGYATIPHDLELAANKLIAKSFNKRKSEGVTGEGAGGANINWGDFVSEDIKAILEKYQKISL
jgi:hypothetical protein